MKRPARLVVLLGLLAASVYLLLNPPREPMESKITWVQISPPPSRSCPAAVGSTMAWTVRMERCGDPDACPADMLEPIRRSVVSNLGRKCPWGSEISHRARHELVIRPRWVSRPGFFSGFGEMEMEVGLLRQGEPCPGWFVWQVSVEVDQGIRGTEAYFLRYLGHVIAGFFRSQWESGMC